MDQMLEQTAQVCPDLLLSISSPISLKLCNELCIPINKIGLHQKLDSLVQTYQKDLKWHIQADHADGGEIGTSLYFKTLTETTSLHARLAENIYQVDGLMMSKTLDKRTNKLRLAKN